MSGGHFNYDQYRLKEMADEIEQIILHNEDTEKNEWGETKGSDYSPETIAKFKETVSCLKLTEAMVQRVDWLISGDDGEESFHKRWQKEVPTETCKWHKEFGVWRSDCGVAFEFKEGNPKECDFTFCYHCGKPIMIQLGEPT